MFGLAPVLAELLLLFFVLKRLELAERSQVASLQGLLVLLDDDLLDQLEVSLVEDLDDPVYLESE